MRACLLIAVLLCGWLDPAFAAGGADAVVRDARRAYQDHKYRRAAELFEKAYAADPVPALKVNAAQAWRLAGDLPRAGDAYAQALDAKGPSALAASDRSFARGKLKEIEKATATVRIDEPVGGTVGIAHVEEAKVPVVVHVMPGSHQLVITEPGGRVIKRALQLRAGEASTVSVVAGEPTQQPTPQPQQPQQPQQPNEQPPAVPPPAAPRTDPPDSGLPPVRIAGWVTLALGVALGGVTGYLGWRTLDASDRWESSGLTDNDAHDEAVNFKIATNVTLAVAIAAGTAGILMLVIPLGDGDKSAGSWTSAF